MQRIKVFESSVNADSTEGRGPMVHVGYFTDHFAALKSVEGRGVMGCGNGDVEETEIVIYDSYKEFQDERNRNLRSRALSKLSWEERQALGLGEE